MNHATAIFLAVIIVLAPHTTKREANIVSWVFMALMIAVALL